MTAYATGALPWADGMLLEDYLDALDLKELAAVDPRAVVRAGWVDDYRHAAQAASLEGFC